MPGNLTAAPVPSDISDPVNARILAVSEDRIAGFVEEPFAEMAAATGLTEDAVIERLLEADLIEELSERPDPAHDDERRRYYRLTPLGRRVAESEAARLMRLLADARASGLVPRKR